MFSSSFVLENWPLFAIGMPVVASVFFDVLTIGFELLDDYRHG